MFRLFKIYREYDEEDYSINRIRLHFIEPQVETRFRQAYFETNLQIGRLCHLIAMFFYVLVGVWDGAVVYPERLSVWLGVMIFVCLVFLAGLTLSYLNQPMYARIWQQLFSFYVLVTGVGFIYVTVFFRADYPVYNFVGIIFCLIFCYTFIRLTFLWAALAGNLIVVSYALSAWLWVSPPIEMLATSLFYIAGINLLGMMVCYSLELMSRRDFLLNDVLRQARNRSRNLNAYLEKKISERTRELTDSVNREKELVEKLEKVLVP